MRTSRLAGVPVAMVVLVSAALLTGCRYDPNHDPAGHVDAIDYVVDADGMITGIKVRGWSFDPDAPSVALQMDVAVDHSESRPAPVGPDGKRPAIALPATERPTCTGIANSSRPDLAAAYPAAGPDHGFECVVAIQPRNGQPQDFAKSDVVVVAKNVQAGHDRFLTVTHLQRTP